MNWEFSLGSKLHYPMGLGEGASSKPMKEVVSELAMPKWKCQSVLAVRDFLIIPRANNP